MNETIDNIITKTTILFPRDLSLYEIKFMINNLTGIGYSFRLTQSGFFNQEENNLEDYINKFEGIIKREDTSRVAQISFNLSDNHREYPMFNSIKFFTPPGYNWGDLVNEEKEFIEQTKKDITDYLSAVYPNNKIRHMLIRG